MTMIIYQWILCNLASLIQTAVIGLVGYFAHRAYIRQNVLIDDNNAYNKSKETFDVVSGDLLRIVDILNKKHKTETRWETANQFCGYVIEEHEEKFLSVQHKRRIEGRTLDAKSQIETLSKDQLTFIYEITGDPLSIDRVFIDKNCNNISKLFGADLIEVWLSTVKNKI